MTSLWNSCLEFIKTDNAKKNIKESIVVPISTIVYNEMYIYVWLICFYHVFLIFIILANLFLVLRFVQHNNIELFPVLS